MEAHHEASQIEIGYIDLLPNEILAEICSFLPTKRLPTVSQVCRRFHDICTLLLYVDPLAAVSAHKALNAFPSLQRLLDSRPDLQQRLRALRLALPGLYTSSSPSPSEAAPFKWTHVNNLTEVRFYVPPVCFGCRLLQHEPGVVVPCHRLIHGAVATIAKRWPGLQTLHVERHNDAECQSAGHASADAVAMEVPRMEGLRHLRIDNRPMNTLSMVQLLCVSSGSLQTLTLDSPHDLLVHVVDVLPVMSGLTHLDLCLKTTEEAIQAVLPRCFPVLKSLRLKHFGWRNFDGCTALDLSQLHYLEDLNVSTFVVDKLPPRIKSWMIADTFLLPRSADLVSLRSMEALCFLVRDPLCVEDRRRKACSWVKRVGSFFPQLKYLEACPSTLVQVYELDLVSSSHAHGGRLADAICSLNWLRLWPSTLPSLRPWW